jgi:hypothetical protein
MPPAPPTRPVTLRSQVEATSRPLLARLHALPRLLIPLGTLLLVVVGAFAPAPVASVAFAVLFCFIAWIAYLSWPAVPVSGRLMRLAMLALIVVLAALRFRG